MADSASLETAFRTWTDAFNRGVVEEAYKMMDDAMVIFDEDIPWRFSKSEFQDHILFHVPLWESFAWVPRELRFQVHGATGVVSGYSTFRGKPRDAGFRQRFTCFTQAWIPDGESWRMVSWQQGVLRGQIEGASPS